MIEKLSTKISFLCLIQLVCLANQSSVEDQDSLTPLECIWQIKDQ